MCTLILGKQAEYAFAFLCRVDTSPLMSGGCWFPRMSLIPVWKMTFLKGYNPVGSGISAIFPALIRIPGSHLPNVFFPVPKFRFCVLESPITAVLLR